VAISVDLILWMLFAVNHSAFSTETNSCPVAVLSLLCPLWHPAQKYWAHWTQNEVASSSSSQISHLISFGFTFFPEEEEDPEVDEVGVASVEEAEIDWQGRGRDCGNGNFCCRSYSLFAFASTSLNHSRDSSRDSRWDDFKDTSTHRAHEGSLA